MDDLDDLLSPKPARRLPQADLLLHTTRHLRRRAHLRRVTKVALVGLVFVAGMMVGWFSKPTLPPEERIEFLPLPVPVVLPADEPTSAGPVAVLTPERLELNAELADGPASADLYRRAGDAFLAAGRIESAVRCYRNHLAGERSAELKADDSWLLVSLKNARQTGGG